MKQCAKDLLKKIKVIAIYGFFFFLKRGDPKNFYHSLKAGTQSKSLGPTSAHPFQDPVLVYTKYPRTEAGTEAVFLYNSYLFSILPVVDFSSPQHLFSHSALTEHLSTLSPQNKTVLSSLANRCVLSQSCDHILANWI